MRPRFHLAPAKNWLSDPNGLVHHEGQWHLFYQYNPHGEDWGHMAWGHAVSDDLASWSELEPALVEEDGVMIFSGAAVVDADNTAGFGADAMVAIYTGARVSPPHQAQCLAWSLDGGRCWVKHEANPVLDLGLADFRDPNVFWHAPSGHWVMVLPLSAENRAAIYVSSDLRTWRLTSYVEAPGTPGHLWECPLLIELPIEASGRTAWLFKVDVLSGAPGSGAIYLTGAFDGEVFTAHQPWRVVDFGADYYAAIAWHDPRDIEGRPCWIGWMGNHAYQAQLPKQGWRGAVSLPRRLSLVEGSDGLRLRQTIEPAIIREMAKGGSKPLEQGACPGPGAAHLVIDYGHEAGQVAFVDAFERSVSVLAQGGEIVVERLDPTCPALNCIKAMPLASLGKVEIWLDHGSLEILADDGTGALGLQHRLDGATVTIQVKGQVRGEIRPG